MTNEKTLCGGQINYALSKTQITISFSEVQKGVMCEDCQHISFCEQLYKMPPARTVLVKAFTGMAIGELAVISETKTIIEVETRKGEHLKFTKATGAQINPKNPKYANKIDPITKKHQTAR
jgi:hypothetical protein